MITISDLCFDCQRLDAVGVKSLFHDSYAMVDLGLPSKLSTVDVVKTSPRSLGGHTSLSTRRY